MAERVLTLRELNRATLARQLLLERKRLSATAVIERVTRFRREELERELASAAVIKATVKRRTLHLVTRRDSALLRAVLGETSFPWQPAAAERLAPSVRALEDEAGRLEAFLADQVERASSSISAE
jgi:hypothetical protein